MAIQEKATKTTEKIGEVKLQLKSIYDGQTTASEAEPAVPPTPAAEAEPPRVSGIQPTDNSAKPGLFARLFKR